MAWTIFQQIMAIMAAQLGFFLLIVGIVNWLSAKFFGSWLRVRMAQGRLWLVKVWTADNKAYYAVGKPDGAMVRYKDKNKQWRRVCMVPEAVYRAFGCDVLETDETSNGIRLTAQDALDDKDPVADSVKVRGGFRAVTGFDAKKIDNLVQWALTLPRKDDGKMRILLILGVLNLLGLILVGYLVLSGGSGGALI